MVVEIDTLATAHDLMPVDPHVSRLRANRAVEAFSHCHKQAADVRVGTKDHRFHERRIDYRLRDAASLLSARRASDGGPEEMFRSLPIASEDLGHPNAARRQHG